MRTLIILLLTPIAVDVLSGLLSDLLLHQAREALMPVALRSATEADAVP